MPGAFNVGPTSRGVEPTLLNPTEFDRTWQQHRNNIDRIEGELRFVPCWPREMDARFGTLRTVGRIKGQEHILDILRRLGKPRQEPDTARTRPRTRHPQSRKAKADEEIRYRQQTCWVRPTRGFLVMARWRLEFGRATKRDSTDCILFGRGFADCSRLDGSHVSASRASWVTPGTASENRTPRGGAAMQEGSGHSAITPEGRRGSKNR
jgi:hypothetical protein